MNRVFATSLVLLILFCGGCIMNTGGEKYSVSGTIATKDGVRLNGIYVRLGDTYAITNTKGQYKFTNIQFNNYFIEADPYDYAVTLYRFEPTGYRIAVKEDMTVNFTAYPR